MTKENENLKIQVGDLKEDLRVQNNQSRARLARNSGLGLLAVAGGLLGGILIGRGCDSADTKVVLVPISTPVDDKSKSDTTPTIIVTRVVTEPTTVSTPEVKGANTMELAKPAAWDHTPVVSLVKVSNVPTFPKTAAEAAALFGVDGSTRNPSRWELTPDGGWHLSEAQIGDDTKDALNVNPKGYLTEGYYDTKPGRNPFAFVIVGIDGNIPAQGATFWNDSRIDQADKLANEMAIPKWKDDSGNVTTHPVVKIVPNQEQKTENLPKYPETADNAASLFGGKTENWEKNSDGGWHLIPQKDGTVISVNPKGRIMDGYNQDGIFVAGGQNSVPTLGGTIWNGSGEAELAKLKDAVTKNNPGKTVKVID